VQRAYGRCNWTTPGGRVENGEEPREAVRREALEETGFVIHPDELIGTYFAPTTNNLVLSYLGSVVGRTHWNANGEIAQWRFFPLELLPEDLSAGAHQRIRDACDGRREVFRVVPDPSFDDSALTG
jgi:8-oxo-dGTP pyrophosphatase MutT (NUDIX family)